MTSRSEQRVLADVAARVRLARQRSGLTQEDAAARARIDAKRWQRIEAGTVNATLRTLTRVARACGITFWELLGASAPAPAAPGSKKRPRAAPRKPRR